jgi:anaerobic ribonucleoside-triphosphate reductase activating protein
MLPFDGGMLLDLDVVIERLTAAAKPTGLHVEGLTLLGGEPLAHAPAALELARAARRLGLSVMVFTGYTLEEAWELADPAVARLLAETDILVDGPYRRDQPERQRRWVGSANQRVHFLTPRCDPDDPRWRLPNTLEIRLQGGTLSVNGFPAPSPSAVAFWKRLARPRREHAP